MWCGCRCRRGEDLGRNGCLGRVVPLEQPCGGGTGRAPVIRAPHVPPIFPVDGTASGGPYSGSSGMQSCEWLAPLLKGTSARLVAVAPPNPSSPSRSPGCCHHGGYHGHLMQPTTASYWSTTHLSSWGATVCSLVTLTVWCSASSRAFLLWRHG